MKKQLLTIFALAAISFVGRAQTYIPNAGFEAWSSQIGEDIEPTDWISYNVFTASLADPGNVNATSVVQAGAPNNYQGTYSAKITTIDLAYNLSPTTIPNRAGIMMVGIANFVTPYLHPGYSTAQRPNTLSYAMKYTPSGADTAYCIVALTHWNGASRDTIAYGLDYTATAVASYQVRNVTLVYNPVFTGTYPDTCQIMFSASSNIAPQAGSVLYVDALAFSGYNSVQEQNLENGVNVYPNPSSTITNFEVISENAYEVIATDMMGREVSRTKINNKTAQIDSYLLAAGVYSYSIVTKENEVISRGKFSVAQ